MLSNELSRTAYMLEMEASPVQVHGFCRALADRVVAVGPFCRVHWVLQSDTGIASTSRSDLFYRVLNEIGFKF
jgi:hypothetical protein